MGYKSGFCMTNALAKDLVFNQRELDPCENSFRARSTQNEFSTFGPREARPKG
jgi:hypothetical protein